MDDFEVFETGAKRLSVPVDDRNIFINVIPDEDYSYHIEVTPFDFNEDSFGKASFFGNPEIWKNVRKVIDELYENLKERNKLAFIKPQSCAENSVYYSFNVQTVDVAEEVARAIQQAFKKELNLD